MYFHFPYELEQNQSISLTNSADVGSPRRIIQIWKISLYATTPELIFALSRKNRHLYIHFINKYLHYMYNQRRPWWYISKNIGKQLYLMTRSLQGMCKNLNFIILNNVLGFQTSYQTCSSTISTLKVSCPWFSCFHFLSLR